VPGWRSPEIPADPLGDPRLGEVRGLIPPLVRNQADDRYDLKTLIAAAGRLDLIHALTAGVDWIVDLVPAEVTLCSVRGAYDDLMAELLLAGILAVYKEIPHPRERADRGPLVPAPGAAARRLTGAVRRVRIDRRVPGALPRALRRRRA